VKALDRASQAHQESKMEVILISLEVLRRLVQKFGLYLVVEAVLPGGTLIALLLYLYRRRRMSPRGESIGA
jgi:hypothetical protein